MASSVSGLEGHTHMKRQLLLPDRLAERRIAMANCGKQVHTQKQAAARTKAATLPALAFGLHEVAHRLSARRCRLHWQAIHVAPNASWAPPHTGSCAAAAREAVLPQERRV
ncbi:hypothetical protein BHM03_00032783 [Ensete ventricosum]|nr:hypothetical protein BHM03_00032783 [Ensete ventricosum]